MNLIFATIIAFTIFIFPVNAVEVNIINSPDSVYRENEFSVDFNIFDPTHPFAVYSYKARIGSSSACLNQAKTLNSLTNDWLDDTSPWINFPLTTLDEAGFTSVSAKVKTKTSSFIGENLLIIRTNRDSKNYDSSSKNILLIEPIIAPIEVVPTTTLVPLPTITFTSSSILTPIPSLPASYDNVYISEVMVNPEQGEKEWVEIYNGNDFDVLLNNWFIDDLENQGSTPKQFNLEISEKNYGVVDLTSSIFNNGGDTVRLLDSNKIEKDSFEYLLSTQGKTWGKVNFEENAFCQQEKSRGSKNNECIGLSPTPTVTTIATTAPAPTRLSVMPIKKLISTTQRKTQQLIKTPLARISNDQNDGEVLAAYDFQKQTDYKNLIKFFSFNSLAYSLLTIFSLSFKIKFRL